MKQPSLKIYPKRQGPLLGYSRLGGGFSQGVLQLTRWTAGPTTSGGGGPNMEGVAGTGGAWGSAGVAAYAVGRRAAAAEEHWWWLARWGRDARITGKPQERKRTV